MSSGPSQSRPERLTSWWITAAVLLAVGAATAGVYRWYLGGTPGAASGEPRSQLRIGSPAPDFGLQGLDGSPISLRSFRGRPAWINFWATWCTPCRAEMPELVTVAAEARGRGIEMVAVDVAESPNDVSAYLRQGDYTSLRVALDPDGRVAAAYRVYGLPTHIFIDSEGIVRNINVGAMSADGMRESVRTLR